jgi:AcrR family transcriptional regulator
MIESAPSRPARRHRDDGLATRRRIAATALRLFRDKGFDGTTMRDIARRARVSLGLAYHYFPSKEAFVLAYYEERQREHAELAAHLLPEAASLAERIRISLETKQMLLSEDRELLSALTRVLIDPKSPLSAFSAETRGIRDQAIRIFRSVFEHEDVPADLRDAAATALWALHMGILLKFVYDDSPGQARTGALIDTVVALLPALLRAAADPSFAPVRAALIAQLDALGLVLRPGEPAGSSR